MSTQLETALVHINTLRSILDGVGEKVTQPMHELANVLMTAQNAVAYGGESDGSISEENWNKLRLIITNLRDLVQTTQTIKRIKLED